jgi:hypothetical protein
LKQILIIFQLVLLTCILNAQRFEFYQETLVFEVSESEFGVNGFYFFKNRTQDTIRQFLLYPFPAVSESAEIVSIQSESLYPGGKEDGVAGWNQKGARIRLFILPFDTAVLNIRYKQSLADTQAEYILTSTQFWEQPLEVAVFEMNLPVSLKVDSLSYDADEMVFSEEGLMYTWRFMDFMPQRNFFVSFSKINQTLNRGYMLPETQIKRLPARP